MHCYASLHCLNNFAAVPFCALTPVNPVPIMRRSLLLCALLLGLLHANAKLIHIKGETSGAATAALFDMAGKQYINTQVSGKQTTLSLTGLPAGGIWYVTTMRSTVSCSL